jgi:hypothetical protein
MIIQAGIMLDDGVERPVFFVKGDDVEAFVRRICEIAMDVMGEKLGLKPTS